jgi:hypothetical protein
MMDLEVRSMVSEDVLSMARKALAKWQPRLRLQDWDIWVDIGNVSDSHWAAQSDKEWRVKRAHITFPSDYLEKMRESEVLPGTTDMAMVEETVIHELLHILEEPEASHVNDDVLWICGDRENGVFFANLHNAWRDYREWWINHMVRTLLEAERSEGWSRSVSV